MFSLALARPEGIGNDAPMTLEPIQNVLLIYYVLLLGIEVVILMGYFDLRRKHINLNEKVEKLQAELDSLKK
jgi:hypothetical protein